ncbi:MAG TPA: M56 family metallopeptidase, partial [Vicinamibacteria bacterium]
MNPLDGYSALTALIAVKATILLLVAFALSVLARNRSASARHVLWALTFVFVLLVPGVAYLSFVQRTVSIPVTVLSSRASRASEASGTSSPGTAPSISSVSSVRPPVPIDPGAEPAAESTSMPWAFLAASLWAAGSLILVSRLGLGLVTSFRVRARSAPVHDDAWIDLLEGARERLGVRRPVALRRSEGVQLPLTLGLFRPAILLPPSSEDYPASR